METPVTNLITDICKAVEKQAEANSSGMVVTLAREIGDLRFLLREALGVAPPQHLARVAERFGLEAPKPAPRPRKQLGLRLTR